MPIAFKLTPGEFNDLEHAQRTLTRFFEQNDLKRENRRLDQPSLTRYVADSEPRRYYAWLRDSLLWTIEELLVTKTAPDPERPYVYALRGLLQVYEYAGKVGHDSTTHDCAIMLRNIMERVCEFGSRGDCQ